MGLILIILGILLLANHRRRYNMFFGRPRPFFDDFHHRRPMDMGPGGPHDMHGDFNRHGSFNGHGPDRI